MLKQYLYNFLKLFIEFIIPLFILAAFIFINFLYLGFGNWLFEINQNYDHLSFIASLLGAAATTFAAITAAILVMNWKKQHNLSLISKLVTEIWDLHSAFTSEIYKLAYDFNHDTSLQEYRSIYSELIQLAVPLRSKTEQLQILFESQIDHNSWDNIQEYLNYLEMFYPWSAIEFTDFRDELIKFVFEFKVANSNVMKVCKKYISLI